MKVIYSPEWEARRIIFALRTLKYSALRVRVVNSLEKANGNSIVVPKFSPNINKQIDLLLGDRNEAQNPQLVKIISDYLVKKDLLLNNNKIRLLTVRASTYLKIACSLASTTFDLSAKPETIQITKFGTGASFTYGDWMMYQGIRKIICLRADFDQSTVLYSLIRSGTGNRLSEIGFTANQQYEIAAFYTNYLLKIKSSNFTPYFAGPTFTAKQINIFSKKKFRGELSYLNFFFAIYKPIAQMVEVSKLLTNDEQKLFDLISTCKGICSYDRIGQILWNEGWENKFSLEGIYKHVSRLKTKLAIMGYPPSTIISVPHKGYIYKR
jgi:hypothetical protein